MPAGTQISYFGPILFESVSNVTLTNSVQLGTKVQYAGEDYVYVFNAGGASASVGNGMVMSGVTGYSVTVSSTSQSDICFGVVKHATFTTACYGWLLTRGFAPYQNGMAATATTSDMLCLAVNGAFAAQIVSGGTGFLRELGGTCGKSVSGCASGVSVGVSGYAYFRTFG